VKSPSVRQLDALVRRFASVRVLVVGDVMLDRFVWGRVERISPEAPVPVVHVTRDDARPGGAGNVVSNVRALGGRAAFAGIVGDDAAGKMLRRMLDDLGASTDGLVVDRHRPTIEKTRIIAHHQQVVRLDREDPPGEPGRAAARVRDHVLASRRRADVMVVSDYNKGVVGAELLEALAASCWEIKPAAIRLGISRPSLYLLIAKCPGLRKAGDLTRAEILECQREHACDLGAMASRLEVSKSGLKQRLKRLGIG